MNSGVVASEEVEDRFPESERGCLAWGWSAAEDGKDSGCVIDKDVDVFDKGGGVGEPDKKIMQDGTTWYPSSLKKDCTPFC